MSSKPKSVLILRNENVYVGIMTGKRSMRETKESIEVKSHSCFRIK